MQCRIKGNQYRITGSDGEKPCVIFGGKDEHVVAEKMFLRLILNIYGRVQREVEGETSRFPRTSQSSLTCILQRTSVKTKASYRYVHMSLGLCDMLDESESNDKGGFVRLPWRMETATDSEAQVQAHLKDYEKKKEISLSFSS